MNKNILWSAGRVDVPQDVWSRLEGLGYRIVIQDPEQDFTIPLAKNTPCVWIKEINGQFNGFLQSLHALQAQNPEMQIILISQQPSIEEAILAVKAGVHDYLSRQASAERLWAAIEGALSNPPGFVGRPNQSHCAPPPTIHPIAVQASMKAMLELGKRVASSRSTILIQGESGTGKEILAHYIHGCSDRSAAPFIAVNCAALPEALLESELFGHERGAFTGAITRKKGKFELADGGTLLLDEISEMAVSIQAKLLRVLQEREFDRLGGQASVAVDVRVIATTNRDLKEEVQKGSFRSDLYYRLNVIPITLPPLRKRVDDIIPLARFFLEKHGSFNRIKPKKLCAEAEMLLQKREWPGNVRELENVMERATLLVEGELLTAGDLETISLPEDRPESQDTDETADDTLKGMEKKMIFHALQSHKGNRTHAARMLGISVRTLRNKLHEYQIEEAGESNPSEPE